VGTVLHNETKEFISNLLKEQRKETYKKGYKDGLKNVVGWSKQYEKMMIEKL
jgi:DNA-binding ferritin-like protein (Dps family)